MPTDINAEEFEELKDLSFSNLNLIHTSDDRSLITNKIFNETSINIDFQHDCEVITVENCTGTSLILTIPDDAIRTLIFENCNIENLSIISKTGSLLSTIILENTKSNVSLKCHPNTEDLHVRLKGEVHLSNLKIESYKGNEERLPVSIKCLSKTKVFINTLTLLNTTFNFSSSTNTEESTASVVNVEIVNSLDRQNIRRVLDSVTLNLSYPNAVLGFKPEYKGYRDDFRALSEVLQAIPNHSSEYKTNLTNACNDLISEIKSSLANSYKATNTYKDVKLDSDYIYWLYNRLSRFNSRDNLSAEVIENLNKESSKSTYKEVYKCYIDEDGSFRIRIVNANSVFHSPLSSLGTAPPGRYSINPYANLPPRVEVTSEDFDSFDPGDIEVTVNTTPQETVDIFADFRPRLSVPPVPPVVFTPPIIDPPTRVGTSVRNPLMFMDDMGVEASRIGIDPIHTQFLATNHNHYMWVDESISNYEDVNLRRSSPPTLRFNGLNQAPRSTINTDSLNSLQALLEAQSCSVTDSIYDSGEFQHMFRSLGMVDTRARPTATPEEPINPVYGIDIFSSDD